MVELAMRTSGPEGAELRADIYRPADGEPAPVVLIRSGYPPAHVAPEIPVRALVDAGLAVVLQYCRGRHPSPGEFVPWDHERADGVEAIEWCAAQPWSTGAVATYGASYLASTQLMTATATPIPPALKAMVTILPPLDNTTFRSGALALDLTLGWAVLLANYRLAGRQLDGVDVSKEAASLGGINAGLDAAFAHLPLRDLPALTEVFGEWNDWLDHAPDDPWWQRLELVERLAEVTVPTFIIGGWFDLFSRDAVRLHDALGPAAHRLVIGPWTHINQTGTAGEVSFGPSSGLAAAGGDGAVIEFLHHHLSGAPAPTSAPVRAFVTGANQWIDAQTWPLPEVTTRSLFLGPQGALLSEPPVRDDEGTTYVSDPHEPVPTLGGATLFAGPTTSGVWDQRRLDARSDIARFVGPVLEADLTIAGSVAAVLQVSTSGTSGDWTAKLIDVHPDGMALNVCDGVIRPEWNASPGQPAEATVDLGPVAHQFARGHRIRLDVASTSFPLIDRNSQTGVRAELAGPDDLKAATVRVWHDTEHPSRIELPVLPLT